MCKFCDSGFPLFPSLADVPEMDVEMMVERWEDVDTGKRGVSLVVFRVDSDLEARFKAAYCPVCGCKLAERG